MSDAVRDCGVAAAEEAEEEEEKQPADATAQRLTDEALTEQLPLAQLLETREECSAGIVHHTAEASAASDVPDVIREGTSGTPGGEVPRGGPVDEAEAFKDPAKDGVASVYAASTYSGGTLASDQRLTPLLKASPPTPVSRVPGRFKVRLWRASLQQPYGVSFVAGRFAAVVVAEDAPHLGFRQGDEVISLNGVRVMGVKQCAALLASARDLEVQLYHREIQDDYPSSMACSGICDARFVEAQELPLCCDVCLNPPQPRCRVDSSPLRDVLLTTGPLPSDEAGIFQLQLVRTSRKQPFGLLLALEHVPIEEAASPCSFSSDADAAALKGLARRGGASRDESVSFGETTEEEIDLRVGEIRAADGDSLTGRQEGTAADDVMVVVQEDLPHIGLHGGDRLLQINGTLAEDLDGVKDILKTAMTLNLEFRRPRHLGQVGRSEDPCWSASVSVAGCATRCSSRAEVSSSSAAQAWWQALTRSFLCPGSGATVDNLGEELLDGLERSHAIEAGSRPEAAL